jgi:uncharacterized protein (TIGR02001 family)
MKKILMITASVLLLITFIPNAKAQEEEASKWNPGLDLYTSYLWRGTKFGTGPSFQPGLKYSNKGFTIGAWGAYSFSNNKFNTADSLVVDAYMEADLYASYAISLGEKSSLTFLVTDYFFPGEGSKYLESDSHYFEPAITLGLGNFSLFGAYMTNANDTYIEAGYNAGPVSLFAGAGDGQYTVDGKFNVCNLGLKSSKEIKITDSFSIPLNGSIVFNPSNEQFHIVVGISL